MRLRFSEQPGVTVSISDFGLTTSAPAYEPMFETLEAAGYTRDVDIRVAGDVSLPVGVLETQPLVALDALERAELPHELALPAATTG